MNAPPLTWLYVPGDRPDRFASALASEADVIIVDLEDAVVADHKEAARAHARALLANQTPKPVVVRINALGTPWGSADCLALRDAPALSGVRVPKVASAADVVAVHDRLGRRALPLHCLIETALGVEAAYDIATAGARVASIGLGEADLRSELGVTGDDGLLWARSRVVVAARAAGLPAPVMSVYPNVNDLDGLAGHCRRGQVLGFLGASAIHPRQLPVIAASFRPTAEETARARDLLDAVAAAEAQGRGGAVLSDGRFVDRAMIEGARTVLALAGRRD